MTAFCKNCKFWTGNRTKPQQGQCRRYPPHAAGVVPEPSQLDPRRVNLRIMQTLPDTAADHWCGEFQPEVLNG